MKIQLLLADAHLLFRHGLRRLLESEPDLQIVAEAGNGKQALELLERMTVDLLITEVALPRVNGIEVVRLAQEMNPCRALMLSARNDSDCVGQALEAGAAGFITKSCEYEQLLDAIRTVSRGRTYLGSDVAEVVVQHYVRHNDEPLLHADHGDGDAEGDAPSHSHGNGHGHSHGNGHAGGRTLTRREREVLQLVAEGYAAKQIAAELCVSVKTVDTHRAALMRKLEIDNIAHLTKYAIRHGITSLEH